MDAPIVAFRGVTCRFGRTLALDAVDLAIEPGTVVALAGRNGAGKTTLLRLAIGVLWPDAGRVEVCGLDPVRDGVAVRTRAALLAEESALFPYLTGAELIELAAGVHPRFDRALAAQLVERLALDPRAKVRTLSRGTKAKLSLLLSVAARPDVLLLDDPTAGLDPLVRREVLEGILDAVPAEGGAVIYASHLAQDLERVCDRLVFLDGGRVRLAAPLDELRARVVRATAVFEGEAPVAPRLDDAIDTRSDGRTLTVTAQSGAEALAAQLRALGATSVETAAVPLEELLVALLREGNVREVSRV